MSVTASPVLRIGPFSVSVDKDRVAAFGSDISFSEERSKAEVPLTFPIIWLSHPEVTAALFDDPAFADRLPILEMQDFSYEDTLKIGDVLCVDVERKVDQSHPTTIEIVARVQKPSGPTVVTFAARYRLIHRMDAR